MRTMGWRHLISSAGATGRSPLYAIVAACAILASCGPAVVLDDVPRDRTMILMNGGPNQYSLFDNQNPYIPGSDQGFHMGTLPAVFEPLIMYNVLTGEYENWLAESWEYNDSFTVLTVKIREGIEWADGVPFHGARRGLHL